MNADRSDGSSPVSLNTDELLRFESWLKDPERSPMHAAISAILRDQLFQAENHRLVGTPEQLRLLKEIVATLPLEET